MIPAKQTANMKNAEEHYREYNFKCYRGFFNKEFFSKMEMLELIKQAQIDAIEATVERCAEDAELTSTPACILSYCECPDYSVDKHSILNVADKMKEELNK